MLLFPILRININIVINYLEETLQSESLKFKNEVALLESKMDISHQWRYSNTLIFISGNPCLPPPSDI